MAIEPSENDDGNHMNVHRIVPIALAAVLVATVAEARQTAPPRVPENDRILFASVLYGAPLRTSASLAVFVAKPNPARHPLMEGLIVEAGAGQGGVRVSAGLARFLEFAGLDLRAVLSRTLARPRGATARAAYGGVEAGMTIYYVRVSAGVAHRLLGPAGNKATIFTWSAAVQIPFK